MKKINKKLIIIFTPIILFMIPIIQAIISYKIQDINYLEALQNIYINLINFILKILTLNIPFWIILCTIIVFIIILFVVKVLYNKQPHEGTHEWDSYKTEKYGGLTYAWDIQYNQIINLRPICECGCSMIEIENDTYNNTIRFGDYLKCPNCKKIYENNSYENHKAVEKIIEYKYNKMIENYNQLSNK